MDVASSSQNASQEDNSDHEQVFWPAYTLPLAVPNARVWTYGYDSGLSKLMSQTDGRNTIPQYGINLIENLEAGLGNKVIIYL